ncbi:MAG: UMP kinase [Candidatus Micrarchaeia archaeon]
MFVVISLGGSLIVQDKPDIKYIKTLAQIIRKSPHKFGIVAGGGKVARIFAQAARDLGASEFEADEAAIDSTRQNARLITIALKGMACPHVFNDFEKAYEAAQKYKVVVMGGTIPGITTDTDAALLAEKVGAKRILNLSNVDGVYSANPHVDKKAKKFKRMTYQQLLELAGRSDSRKAGTHFVFDFVACKMIGRSGIETHFINGRNLDSLKAAIDGKPHSGTIVRE